MKTAISTEDSSAMSINTLLVIPTEYSYVNELKTAIYWR